MAITRDGRQKKAGAYTFLKIATNLSFQIFCRDIFLQKTVHENSDFFFR